MLDSILLTKELFLISILTGCGGKHTIVMDVVIIYFYFLFYRFARGKEGRCFGSNYAAGRTNENRIDLNRNFPTWKEKSKSITEIKKVRFKSMDL